MPAKKTTTKKRTPKQTSTAKKDAAKSTTTAKTSRYKVDQFRSTLSTETRAEFDAYVRTYRPTAQDALIRLKALGYEGSAVTVSTWLSNFLPIGKDASDLNAKALDSAGIQVYGMMELSLAATVKVLQKSVEKIEKESTELDAQQALNAILAANREIRNTANALSQAKAALAEREMMMAGAYAVMEEIERTFKGSPKQLVPIQECIRAAIDRIENE
jgi:hypothetical protein